MQLAQNLFFYFTDLVTVTTEHRFKPDKKGHVIRLVTQWNVTPGEKLTLGIASSSSHLDLFFLRFSAGTELLQQRKNRNIQST